MNLTTALLVTPGDTLMNTPNAPGHAGGVAFSRDGRRFRLVKNGGVALAQGVLAQSFAAVASHATMAPTVDVPIGARSITVMTGSGAGVVQPANTYAGGLAIVSTGPGQGQAFAVRSHGPIAASTALQINLEADETVLVALTAAASKVDLIASPYVGVIASLGTAAAACPVGVTLAPIDPGNWGWVQVEGLAAVLADGAIGVGQAVSPSVAVAGAVVINSTTLPVIGSAVAPGVAGRAVAVYLSLT